MAFTYHTPHYQPHGSQFIHNVSGLCTLFSLAACDIVAKGLGAFVLSPHTPNPQPDSVANLQAVAWRLYVEARQHGLCETDGAANQWDMVKLAGLIGLPIRDILPYSEDMPSAMWIDFLRTHIAHSSIPYPLLLQVSNGRALHDIETDTSDEPDLQYHAITLYGTKTDPSDQTKGGYIGNDSDQPVNRIDAAPVCYTLATLEAAHPVSMIAFNYVVKG